ncbi:MAG: glycoside hydrolase family 5 protein [Prevotella sp.]|nr:glycoside hydrolase family 5 protein [Prevotella sp.]
MKLKNIIFPMSLAAVALIATSCQDTDAQIDITEVDAPQYVSAYLTEEKPIFFGETTIKVAFDKNIGFATKNTSQITINGEPVDKALVAGASKELTVTKSLDFCKTIELYIPGRVIVGPQGKTYENAIGVTFKVKEMPNNEATAMTQKLGWGWNLGNHFDTNGDAIKNGWGYWDGVDTPTAGPFEKLALHDAKTVRIPTTWTDHMDDSYTISADYLNEVKGVVDLAIGAGLNVILNTHHDSFETDLGNAATNNEAYQKDSTIIVKLWEQVATKFASYSDQLIFETFNEIHAGDNWGGGTDAEYALLNKWNQWAVDAIRKTGGNNATRWIGVAGYAANIDLTVAHLVLPNDPANRIMVSVHCYDPYNFCLQPYGDDGSALYSAEWGHAKDGAGAEELNAINQLYKVRAAYIEKDIPCYLGEYGCVWKNTDYENAFRAYYLEFFCRAANLAGIPMFVWDNNAKNSGNEANGYIDHKTGEWLNDSETIVPMMIKACTSTDSNYGFSAIWAKSPAAKTE